MLPDIRMLIAATLASVVALIFWFAMFAALRVRHEPLAQLPPAEAPTQLLVEGAATPMAYATPEPFERRFQVNETQPPGEAVASQLRMLERRQESDQGGQPAAIPSAAPPRDDTVVAEPVAATNTSNETPPIPPVAPTR